MKISVQRNSQVSIDSRLSRNAALIEQVRVARSSGFNAFSIGEHYKIPRQTDVRHRTELAAEDTEGLDKLEEALDSLRFTS